MEPSIIASNLSKCYKLGVIGRQTLIDEVRYWWLKVRGRDPQSYFRKIGHSAKEIRRVQAEDAGRNHFWALKDISFESEPGEVVGIIGRNGAGKSTLLKILGRITEPTSGEAVLNGRVASLLEVGTGFHPELTGRENVYMNGAILGMKKREIELKFDEIVAFSELEQFIDTPVKRYSNGMHVRLAFAVAAHLEPEILLVDEVLAVGDMEYQKKCMGKMHDISKGGRTVLFVSHNMPVVSRLCGRAFLLDHGNIVCRGSADEVVKQYMQASLQSTALREWPLDEAPGDNGFKLLSVSITDMDGNAVGTVDIEKPFRLRIEYHVAVEGLSFRSMARFYTQGVCAFPAFEQTNVIHDQAGRYVTYTTIPRNLLSEGEYVIGLSFFGAKGRKYNYCSGDDFISFLVVDYMRGGSARGDLAAGLEGVMRPFTSWGKKYLGSD